MAKPAAAGKTGVFFAELTPHVIALISGDIVNSSKLSSTQFELLLQRIQDIQQRITAGHQANAHSIERGDEFQSLVHDIENALKYTLLYRIGIKAPGKEFDNRISVAIAAQADLRALVSQSMGKAFVLSGRGLKALKGERLIFSAEQPALTEQFELPFKYLDRQFTALAARQCAVMLPMLQATAGLSINELAEQLDVATATASKSLKASGWPLIQELNRRYSDQVAGLQHG